jgi:hypothetical protein
VLFHVDNKHVADSGIPPQIDGNTPNRYHSYFENEYGEQMVFVYDYEANTGTLWFGDIGWQNPQTVTDGKVPNLVLNEPEKLWLQACWQAATTMLRFKK